MRLETGFSYVLKRRTRCSTRSKQANSWKAWSQGRSVKSRTSSTGILACVVFVRSHQHRHECLCYLAVVASLFTTACRQDMHDQPKYKPLARGSFFDDNRASRPLPAGVIAQGQLRDDEQFYTGKSGDKPVAA